jgi:uncharacterized protein
MILHLDEFDEGESLRTVHVDASAEQASQLLHDSGYRVTGSLSADLQANLVGTTVRVHGPMSVDVEFECGRCLEMRKMTVELEAEFVLLEKSEWSAKYEGDDEIELSDDDMDVSFYEGDEIDLTPLVREAVLLDLPLLPRCSDEDRAICDEAYRRNVGEAALEELDDAALDQRWAALKDIKLKD